MSEGGEGAQSPSEGKRGKIGQLLQQGYEKGEIALKHALGLGATENVVPVTQPSAKEAPRPVEVGWHPVGGLAGKWFAEQTGLGKMITERTNHYPDPTQHWAVLVGDYAHQLWMDENFDIIYTNARRNPDEWRTFPVGETCFNDDALRRTGEAVIHNIRSTKPGYNLISNNCQTYVLQLLDAIKVSEVKEFGTTLAVYDRLFGAGKVADLFVDESNPQAVQPAPVPVAMPPVGEQETGVIGSSNGGIIDANQPLVNQEHMGIPPQQNSVLFAQQVMHANTPQLEAHEQLQRGMPETEEEPKMTRSWSDKTSSFFRKLKK